MPQESIELLRNFFDPELIKCIELVALGPVELASRTPKSSYDKGKWSKVLNGKVFPLRNIPALAEELGCDADYLAIALLLGKISRRG